MIKTPTVYIKFPKAGLGNLLLIWAHGIIFAKINKYEYVTSSWFGFRWGALVRTENRNRLYFGYFQESNLFKRIYFYFKTFFCEFSQDPLIQINNENSSNCNLYVFQSLSQGPDLFYEIRDYNHFLRSELENILARNIKKRILQVSAPIIGVHIRRGDFKIANPITPNVFFIEGINIIRSIANMQLPVTIFSDGDKDEISDILELPNVHLAAQNPDIVDILLLSKSKILMLSQSSTFSYWAAFFSEAITIRPKNDWLPYIKKDSILGYKEFNWDFTLKESKELLIQNITPAIKDRFKNYLY